LKEELKYLKQMTAIEGNPRLGTQTIAEMCSQNQNAKQNGNFFEKILENNLMMIQAHFRELLFSSNGLLKHFQDVR